MAEGVFRPKYRWKGKLKQQKTWHIKYRIDGKRYVESSRSTRQSDAIKLRAKRLAERGRGLLPRDLEKVTFSELKQGVLTDYRNNHRKSLDRLERSLTHLTEAFGSWRAVQISEDIIERYKQDRKVAGAANGTVNRELAALRRMFRLGQRHLKVGRIPNFNLFVEDNIKTGFFEDAEVRELLSESPWPHAAWIEFESITGWRTYSEVLTRQWKNVDMLDGWVRLEPGETKNGRGRQFPLIPTLRNLFERQLERKKAIEQQRSILIPWVFFHTDGRRIKSFRSAMKARRNSGPHAA